MGVRRVGGPVIRTVAVAVAGVALLTSCGRLQAKQHPFPEAVGQSTASPGASATATPRGSASPIPTGSLPPDRLAELPAEELFKRAKAATQRVKTVHTGAELNGRDMSISFDIRIDLQSRDFVGSITMDGGKMEIRRIGSDAWLKADVAFWKLVKRSDSEARYLSTRSVHVTDSMDGWSEFMAITDLTDPAAPLAGLRATEKRPMQNLGVPTIPVVVKKGSGSATVWLAPGNDLLPVRLEDRDGGASLTYREYDVPVQVVRPPASEVIEAPKGAGLPLPGA